MMTEEEAREKWCPFARVVETLEDTGEPYEGYPVGNRSTTINGHPYAKCLASECMSWRWARAKETKAYLAAVQAHMKATGDNFNKATQAVYAEIGSTFEQVEGYCGLASKPE